MEGAVFFYQRLAQPSEGRPGSLLRRKSRVRGYARVARCAAENQDGCVGGGAWDHHSKINVSLAPLIQ